MAVFLSTKQGRVLKFHSDALEPNTLLVASFTVHEEISRPWSAQIECVSTKGDIDSAAILKAPAWLGIKQSVPLDGGTTGLQTLRFQGVVESFEQCEKGKDWIAYRVKLRPKISRLALNVRSAIYLEQTVPQIVEQVLKEHGLTGDDYEFVMVSRSYPTREYVCQYQEADDALIGRLLEGEGIFGFGLQGESSEKWILADSTGAYAPILGPSEIPYRPDVPAASSATSWFEPERVRRFVLRHRITPSEVTLNDYNYRTPSVALKSSSSASSDGYGTVYLYGDHFKDANEGATLAKIRAEELTCRERIFHGESDARAFRAGATFTLTNHYREDFNAEYVITKVKHRAEQALVFGRAGSPEASYSNEFECIPASVTFRPERITPKPRIAGTLNAKVDAAGDGQYAEIDDQGRYKVTMPFDLSGKKGGTASRYLRMVQPYAGAEMGMHFPLHAGTETVLAFMNGDIDRPYMAGASPNYETTSVITGANQTQCKIKTGGKNEIVLEDLAGSERIRLSTPHTNTYLSLGAPNDDGNVHMATDGNSVYETGGNEAVDVTGDRDDTVDGDTTETVGKNNTKSVLGNWALTIGGTSDTIFADRFYEEYKAGKSELMMLDHNVVNLGGLHHSIIGELTTAHFAYHFNIHKANEISTIKELLQEIDLVTRTIGNSYESIRAYAVKVATSYLQEANEFAQTVKGLAEYKAQEFKVGAEMLKQDADEIISTASKKAKMTAATILLVGALECSDGYTMKLKNNKLDAGNGSFTVK